MKITEKWLKEKNACSEGVEWFNAQEETDNIKVLSKLIKENRWNWANWTICRIFNRKQKIKYAVFAAEQVLDIFEKKYPNDKRPHKAIEAAKKVLKNDTKENRKAAAAAAAADAAAYAADAAAYAAAYAAAAADADAAAYAAAAAAADAAYVADIFRKEMQSKIINYGIKLLVKA